MAIKHIRNAEVITVSLHKNGSVCIHYSLSWHHVFIACVYMCGHMEIPCICDIHILNLLPQRFCLFLNINHLKGNKRYWWKLHIVGLSYDITALHVVLTTSKYINGLKFSFTRQNLRFDNFTEWFKYSLVISRNCTDMILFYVLLAFFGI